MDATGTETGPTKPDGAVTDNWSDDSLWAPRHITTSLSLIRDGILAAVAVHTDHTITWTITPDPETHGVIRVTRGHAATIPEACTAALDAIRDATAVLF